MDINQSSETVKTDIYTLIAYERGFLHKEELPSIREDLEEILNYFPEHKLSLFHLFLICRNSREWIRAEELLLRIIELYPESYEYQVELLYLYSDGEFKDTQKKLNL